ncbi:Cys-Gln thioester bond-forming surface protein, partial [Tyzzerella sp. OttesenSCG-928-J15]|nr:Cys-Gln thioester bond-forming surface protein [Tyzzerella sp. OttesenSCG-928-J15]
MKKSNKRLSRFLSFLMALITLFSALPLEQVQAAQTVKPKLTMEMPVNDMIPITPKGVTRFSTFNSPVTYYENQKLQIENVAGKGLLISVGGANDTANFAPSQVTWTNPDTGQVYQAYCVNAAYSGYGDVANYDITVMEFGDTVQFSGGGSNGSGHAAGDSARGSSNSYKEALWGAVSYGYPSRTAEEVLGGTAASFGVSQEVLEYSAYAATKFAIWAIVHNNYTLDKWSTAASGSYPQTLKTATLNAQKAIYNYALNFQGITVADVSFSASKPEADPINKVYEITYTISSENIVPNTDMYLRMDESYSPFPAEMTITDMSGNSFATGSDSTKP